MSLFFCAIALTTIGAIVAVSMRPEVGGYVRRKKKIFFLLDLSPSMEQPPEKINSANDALRSSIEKLKLKVGAQERAEVELVILGFSSDCRPLKSGLVRNIEWEDAEVCGSGTHLGPPLLEIAKQMKVMEDDHTSKFGQSYIILVSDGQPQDPWQTGLAAILATEPGRKCGRLAIGIGDDVDLQMLHEFMGNDPDLLPLHARSAEEIVRHIEFGTTILPFLGCNGGPGAQANPPQPLQPPTHPSSDDFPKLVI